MHRHLKSLVVFHLVLVAGCASQEEKLPNLGREEQSRNCQMTDGELRQLKSRALAFLIKEWPVLDDLCEEITDSVFYTDSDGCIIYGGPRKDGVCPDASHMGYGIAFSRENLEPTQIYFLSE